MPVHGRRKADGSSVAKAGAARRIGSLRRRDATVDLGFFAAFV
jgi:hypothetical protein